MTLHTLKTMSSSKANERPFSSKFCTHSPLKLKKLTCLFTLVSCYCNVLPKPKLSTKFELAIASTVAERSRGVLIFSMLPSPDPVSFCPKSCFLVSYCPNQTRIPNLKLLASTVAEINWVPKF